MDHLQVQSFPQSSYRTAINVLSGCRLPLEMNNAGTQNRSDMCPHSRRHRMGDIPHHPSIQLQLSPHSAWSRGSDKLSPLGTTYSSDKFNSAMWPTNQG